MNQIMTPFRALNDLHRELNRVFDDRALPRQEAALYDSNWAPQVDITENEEGYSVLVDLPGVAAEDVEVSVHNTILTIRGERKAAEVTGDFRRRERVEGSFLRQFSLPESVDEAGVSATARNGVLHISIPRAAVAKPISITVEGD